MMDVTKGGAGFSQMGMRGQQQQDVAEGGGDPLARGDAADGRAGGGKDLERQAHLSSAVSHFQSKLKSALGANAESDKTANAASLGALVSGAGSTRTAPAPEAKAVSSAAKASIEQIARVVETQMRVEALSSRAVSVRLHIPALAAGELRGVVLRLDGGGLSVSLLHAAEQIPALFPEITAGLAEALGARWPQRSIRVESVREAEENVPGGLSALSQLIAPGGAWT